VQHEQMQHIHLSASEAGMNKRDTARSDVAENAVSCRNEELVSAGDREMIFDGAAISALINFFKLLDKWDREAKQQ
jgi:hypothetical protein